jgi:hypothetical protein
MQLIGLVLFGAGLVILTLSIVANESFPKPPRVPTGREICQDGPENSERCGEEYKLADVDLGNPGWIDWFQRHQGNSIALGIVLTLVGLHQASMKRVGFVKYGRRDESAWD